MPLTVYSRQGNARQRKATQRYCACQGTRVSECPDVAVRVTVGCDRTTDTSTASTQATLTHAWGPSERLHPQPQPWPNSLETGFTSTADSPSGSAPSWSVRPATPKKSNATSRSRPAKGTPHAPTATPRGPSATSAHPNAGRARTPVCHRKAGRDHHHRRPRMARDRMRPPRCRLLLSRLLLLHCRRHRPS